MKSVLIPLVGACLVLADASLVQGQGSLQKYVPAEWEYNRATKAWECTYYFKTSPNAKQYQAHVLIYRPGESWIYYRNVAKNVIWCRAIANPAKNQREIWVVLADADKRRNIEDIPAKAWNRKAVHPRIPGWTGPNPAPLMLPPPRVPNPV